MQSIYITPPSPNLSELSLKDQLRCRLGIFATELRTVERLMTMGWEKANGLKLEQFIKWLID